MTGWPPSGVPTVARGIPITSLGLAGEHTVEVGLSDPDGHERRMPVEMSRDWAIPGAHPSGELSETIEARHGPRARRSVLESVFAFWYAARPDPDAPPDAAPPRLRRIAVQAPDRYELIGDERRLVVTVGADGTIVGSGTDLARVGEPALVAAAVAELHATRTLGDAGPSHRRPKQARSIAEAGAYLISRLPAAERAFDWRSAISIVPVDLGVENGEAWVVFERPDGDPARIDVHVPAGFVHSSGDDRYLSYGIGRSTLLDAGQWLDVEQRQAALAEDLAVAAESISDGGSDGTSGRMSDRTYNDILRALRLAAGAADELAKFLPGGADTVPDDAFWTAESRFRRGASPELFHRGRIEAARARYRDAIDAHIARHGPGTV